MSAKATRSDHYLAIAEFYGRMLIEDMGNPNLPEFVLVHSARRTAHFALEALRMSERRAARRRAERSVPAWTEPMAAISGASLS